MRHLVLLIAGFALAGCQTASDTLDNVFSAPVMSAPKGISSAATPQDTAALEARAARERENLPKLPPPADPETYSNLGTVPPKPVLPTEAEITGQVKGLAQEQQAGEAAIERQANSPIPDTLLKAGSNWRPSATRPALDQSAVAVPIAQPPQLTYLPGADALEGEESTVFSRDNQAFLPTSQIESTDRASSLQP